MRLPRDLSGHELIKLLRRYEVTLRGSAHQVTVPSHRNLRLGTLSAILSDVADYLDMERSKLATELFER